MRDGHSPDFEMFLKCIKIDEMLGKSKVNLLAAHFVVGEFLTRIFLV